MKIRQTLTKVDGTKNSKLFQMTLNCAALLDHDPIGSLLFECSILIQKGCCGYGTLEVSVLSDRISYYRLRNKTSKVYAFMHGD